jgi:hypothetical protein
MAPEGAFLRSSTHPRSYGNFARLLGKYVREEKVITLQEAIRRLSSLPATNLGLDHRGLLKEGMFADVVVFDPETISDRATFENPHQYSDRSEACPGEWSPGLEGRRTYRCKTRSSSMGPREDQVTFEYG